MMQEPIWDDQSKNKYCYFRLRDTPTQVWGREGVIQCFHPDCSIRKVPEFKPLRDFEKPVEMILEHRSFYEFTSKRWYNDSYKINKLIAENDGIVGGVPGRLWYDRIKYPIRNVLYRIGCEYKLCGELQWARVETLVIVENKAVWPNPPVIELNWNEANWKINKFGTIKWKDHTRDMFCHQNMNYIEHVIIRVEFNIIVVYFVLKLKVLAKRARKSVSSRRALSLCLRACHYKHKESPFSLFAGTINYPIKTRIFAEYGLVPEIKGVLRLLEFV